MNDRIMVKARFSDKGVEFQTFSKQWRSSDSFYVPVFQLRQLASNPELVVSNVNSFATMWLDRRNDRLSIHFSWLRRDGDRLNGRYEHVVLPYGSLMDAVARCDESGAPTEWRALSEERTQWPRFVFKSRNNLHAALSVKPVRRKLVRFLRDNFKWPGADQIVFCDDLEPYSFGFTEFCGEARGITGGVILHGREDLNTARYSIHT